jgi:nicotinate-nucleotide adenylyltransferase
MELVFGGSFDPPTLAHVVLPQAAALSLNAERVRFVPAAISPHKTDTPPVAAEHRLSMLQMTLADWDQAVIDLQELDREGPSYTIDTLEALAEQDPCERRLLMGSDQAVVFHRWHRWNDIIALAEPVVVLRDTDDADTVLAQIEDGQGNGAADAWRGRLLDLDRRLESSSSVRATGDLHQVCDAVANYIQEHNLYEVAV